MNEINENANRQTVKANKDEHQHYATVNGNSERLFVTSNNRKILRYDDGL